ncbi:hypothetical protein WJX84_005167 [Apatococcus fuscideae]|uniref:Uncharacterized protein n=1 Tax=Apatococcus fuscideae TaxID=2026836 RepID=A0AAW1T4R6_9CHLO
MQGSSHAHLSLERADWQWQRQLAEERRRWRQEDLEQRTLENARVLWARFVEQNRRDIEERSEQLKTFSNLAALLAGFAMLGILQFDFDNHGGADLGVIIAFGVMVSFVVALSLNSMMICGLIHASIMKVGHDYVSEEQEAEFMASCREFALRFQPGDRPPRPRRTFQNHWASRCEREWRRGFYLFSASVPSFIAMLALAAWIKFYDQIETAIVMTGILGASLAFYLGAQGRWAKHIISDKPAASDRAGEPVLRPLGLPFDWHQQPRVGPNSRPVQTLPLHRKMSAALGNRLQAYLQPPHLWPSETTPSSNSSMSADPIKVEMDEKDSVTGRKLAETHDVQADSATEARSGGSAGSHTSLLRGGAAYAHFSPTRHRPSLHIPPP